MAGAARRSSLFLLGLVLIFLALAAQAFVVPKTSLKGKLLHFAAAEGWLNVCWVQSEGEELEQKGGCVRWSRSNPGDL
jgi:hypothetical protein